MKKKHEYMITKWSNEKGGGTSCIFRTTDRGKWIEQIKEMVAKPIPHYSRIIVYEDRTIWSFANDENGWLSMCEANFVSRPIQVYIGIPDGMLD